MVLTSVAYAAATAYPLVTAIVMATSSMPSACAGVTALVDADADGICDNVDPCVGELDECGICNGPGAIYACGCSDIPKETATATGTNSTRWVNVEDRVADADADGICDDVDECVGELDECGICNGPGAIYECGCSDIPEGDCGCDGNQLDALGECGGACVADADADGICDDEDDCVGALDACGICNGPGAIYECGVPTSLMETATATATNSMHLACVAVNAPRTPMPMAFAMTRTTALANSMRAASATVLAPSTSVDAQMCLKATATVTATSSTRLACAVVTA